MKTKLLLLAAVMSAATMSANAWIRIGICLPLPVITIGAVAPPPIVVAAPPVIVAAPPAVAAPAIVAAPVAVAPPVVVAPAYPGYYAGYVWAPGYWRVCGYSRVWVPGCWHYGPAHYGYYQYHGGWR